MHSAFLVCKRCRCWTYGWLLHQSVEESLDVIRNIFNGKECYAICEINSDEPIGLVELKLNGHTDKTQRQTIKCQ